MLSELTIWTESVQLQKRAAAVKWRAALKAIYHNCDRRRVPISEGGH